MSVAGQQPKVKAMLLLILTVAYLGIGMASLILDIVNFVR